MLLPLQDRQPDSLHRSSSIRVPGGQDLEITPDVVQVARKVFKESVREYTPNVIEPSFGIGRILYSLLEHSYWAREEDVARGVLSLPPVIAPIKVLIVPISGNDTLRPIVRQICTRSLTLLKPADFGRVVQLPSSEVPASHREWTILAHRLASAMQETTSWARLLASRSTLLVSHGLSTIVTELKGSYSCYQGHSYAQVSF
jgi:hypothetical protein